MDEMDEPKSARLIIAKDSSFGAYGTVSGWNIFLEDGNKGGIVKSKYIGSTDSSIIFEVDIISLLNTIGDYQTIVNTLKAMWYDVSKTVHAEQGYVTLSELEEYAKKFQDCGIDVEV